MSKEPCKDCPFRRRTFTKLDDESVGNLLEHAEGKRTEMYCHESLDAFGLIPDPSKEKPCIGFAAYRANKLPEIVFSNARQLVRAHHRSTRKPVFFWRD